MEKLKELCYAIDRANVGVSGWILDFVTFNVPLIITVREVIFLCGDNE